MTDPDSPEAYDNYELKFRLVCKRCGFAGYSVPLAKDALLTKGWNEAVFDYCSAWYVAPTAHRDGLIVKRPCQRHSTKHATVKTPRTSAARDSGQDPSQLTINDIPGVEPAPTYDCYKESDNVTRETMDEDIFCKTLAKVQKILNLWDAHKKDLNR
jgi:hypothetical protein